MKVATPEQVEVVFWVNGQRIQAQVCPDATLLWYLREELRLTGAKVGCDEGSCGVCAVLVDGKAKNACLVTMGKVAGKRVETIESLGRGPDLHPLQKAFAVWGAVQCGFCTPAFILAARALLDRNPDPSVAEIKRALAPNHCRCTGYNKIIQAVQAAARVMREGGELAAPSLRVGNHRAIGRPLVKKDALDKVTGQPIYADDLSFPGMLYGKILLSAEPHALIRRVDTAEAERAPGVHAVLTARDVPGKNEFGRFLPDQVVLAEQKVRSVGDAVALVLAETPEQAEAARRLIRAEYEPLEVITNPWRALEPDAPKLHPDGNLLRYAGFEKGDLDQGFAEADVIVEGEYSTPFIEHAYLEPESGVGVWDEERGVVTVWSPCQDPFCSREQIAVAMGLPVEQVRMVTTEVGGAFGGKGDISVQILVALGAYHTKRPVKITLQRAESLRISTKKHACWMRYRTGAKRDGTLTAMDACIVADTGAYASTAGHVLDRASLFGAGPYCIPHVRVDTYAVHTNNLSGGAMRGMGANQVCFAVESQLDRLARELGLDPIELRLKNALDIGREAPWGETLTVSVGLPETLRLLKRMLAETPLPKARPGKRLGVGIASGSKNCGLGAGRPDNAQAEVELRADGRILVRTGTADLGQGSSTVFAQIAAEALGVDYDLVDVVAGDTGQTPPAGPTAAMRATYISGGAVLNAATNLRNLLVATLAGEFAADTARIEIDGDRFVDAETGQMIITLRQFARATVQEGQPLRARGESAAPKTYPLLASMSRRKPMPTSRIKPAEEWDRPMPEDYRVFSSFPYATAAAIVEADEKTGEVEVLKVIVVQDAGRVLNPLIVEGQIEGCVSMGLGYALSEEFLVENGRVKTDTLAKCHIPNIKWTPEVMSVALEDPEPSGPFGAKGISEVALLPVTPAITNAIYDALGHRVCDLPADRQKLARRLKARGQSDAVPTDSGGTTWSRLAARYPLHAPRL